jgi:hypothetical protein
MQCAAGTATGRRDVFAVDEGAAPTELARPAVGYHGFSADDGIRSVIGRAGQVLTGATPDELGRTIRAQWQARQSQGVGR